MDQRTEDNLLLYCLGDKIRVSKLEQLSSSDWDNVIQQSVRHGVIPLLYQQLKTLSPGTNIPVSIMQKLQQTYLRNAVRNVGLYHKLSNVLRVLRDDGIEVIVLKGAHLAEVVYGNIAFRPMVDVDLLVRKSDLLRIERKLLKMGYVLSAPSDNNKIWFLANLYFFKYVSSDRKLSIDVHWNIQFPTSAFKLDVEEFWERARPATIAGIEVSVLSPADLLLHLCLHIYKHQFYINLRSLFDIAETIRHYQDKIDWEQVQLRARHWGADKCLYLILRLTKELLAAAVPDDVLDMLKPDDFNLQIIVEAKERVFTNNSNASLLSPNLNQLWKPERLWDKITPFLKSIFPSPEIIALVYSVPSNSKRIYFYYLVRLKDSLLQHSRMVWRLLWHDKEIKNWLF